MTDSGTSHYWNLERKEQKAVLETLIFSTDEAIPAASLMALLSGSPEQDKGRSESDEKGFESLPVPNEKNMEIHGSSIQTPEYIEQLIEEINSDLFATGRPYKIVKIAGAFQFATRPEYGQLMQSLVKSKIRKRLSRAAFETLAIIAYKQPVTKPEVEQIRGVNSSELFNSLVEKNLIRISGRKEVLGRPLIYETTNEFLKVFGLNSLEELPRLREIEELNVQPDDGNRIFEIEEELVQSSSLIIPEDEIDIPGNEDSSIKEESNPAESFI